MLQMIPERQIKALLYLLDDPDEEVAALVQAELMGYGKELIPQLENYWEKTENEGLQQRIEALIHRVHLTDLQQSFIDWAGTDDPDLLEGALLVARYGYPEMNTGLVMQHFEKIKRNLWLEVNNYLSPVEQVNAFNSVLYGYYKLQGAELAKKEPKNFFFNVLLESRAGNAYTIGILYLALCERLDVPLFPVDIPRQFIFAYIDTFHPEFGSYAEGEEMARHIRFYVDPVNGNIYTHADVENYLNKMGVTDRMDCYLPLSAREIIRKMLRELAQAYRHQKQDEKAEEVFMLADLLEEAAGT